MPLKTLNARRPDPVKQFSVFTAHRIGQLHDLARLFSQQHVNILGLTIVDNTDSAIIRCVVDDPDRARQLMDDAGFPYTESDVVVTEVNSTEELREAIAAFRAYVRDEASAPV